MAGGLVDARAPRKRMLLRIEIRAPLWSLAD